MEQTITNLTIINYNSFLALRPTSIPRRNEQSVSERVLEMAERVLENFQTGLVDSIISAAAELENRGSYSDTCQALPYYQPPWYLPRY
jgi:hypothetical protein